MDPEMVMQPGGIEWRVSETPVDYLAAVEEMEGRVAAIRAGAAAELVWLLDHPPLYTAGTSARDEELIEPRRLPVHRAGRGGRYTYHGPGQRIAYVMLDLRRRGLDVRCYVHQL
jgi:lipoyl(octanoyl) transferase